MTPVFRFAPSPNGELHIGHARSALECYLQSQAASGRFLLRIEDIDTGRCREPFVVGIFEDLAWLGLTWEQPVLRQSQHFPFYQAMAAKLEDQGLLYPCFATRTEIEAAANPAKVDPDGAPLYPGLHKHLSKTEIQDRKAAKQPFAMRLNMERALEAARLKSKSVPLTWCEHNTEQIAQPEVWGDAVIIRKDTPASYHLAVVADDARQGITHVTRGYDLFHATALHRLLQVLLGLPGPHYAHHRLVTDGNGRKLSKSAADTSLRALRDAGATVNDIWRMAGFPVE